MPLVVCLIAAHVLTSIYAVTHAFDMPSRDGGLRDMGTTHTRPEPPSGLLAPVPPDTRQEVLVEQ